MRTCWTRRGSTFRSAWSGAMACLPRWPMPANFTTAADLIRFLPEIILTVMGTLLMVLDPVLHRRASYAFGHLSIFALLAALGAAVYAYTQAGPAFGGMLVV